MPGPLPTPNHRRRNAPTIPTTVLPAGGRPGPVPKVPHWKALGPAGLAWWAWAWKTPESAAWSDGHHVAVARRASIEDDLAAMDQAPTFDVAAVLEVEEDYRTAEVKWLVTCLLRLATGKTTLDREARELDKQLGLTPKGFADLRWTIRDDEAEPKAGTPKPTAAKSRSRKLKIVDTKAG